MINANTTDKTTNAQPTSAFAKWRLRLITPSKSIQNTEHRRQARLLSLLLILLLPLFFIPETIRSLLSGKAPIYFGVATVAMIIAYRLSRTRHYRWGIFLTLATLSANPFTVVLAADYNSAHLINTLIWIMPTIILGGLMLSFKNTFLLIAANMLAILALPLLTPAINFPDIILPLSFAFTLAVLVLTAVKAHQNDVHYIANQKQAISQSNAYLQNILESITTPFYVINIEDYSIQLANSAARALGISAQGPAATCYKLTHRRDTPCDGLDHPCPLAIIRNTKQPTTVEHIHFDKHGNPRIVEVHGYPILDENGTVKQMVEYSIDITKRREAEGNVRKLSRAVEQSASAILITNLDGIIEYVNPGFANVTGYTLEEAIGQHTRVLKSGHHSQEFYANLWGTISRGDVWQGEMVNKKKNGDHYWEFTTMSPVKDLDGRITHYLAIKEDITKQKQAEENIRKLSRAVEQSGSSIVITDLDGTIEYVNPAFTEVTGYTSKEAIGQNPRVLKSDKQPPELYTDLWQTISSGEVWQGELINKKKNGDHYWEFATISPVKDEHGDTTHFLAIKEDITLRKQAEKALTKAHARAEEASRLKTQLLANVSHDMRTPLGSIMGYTEMLQAGVYGDLSEQQIDIATRIIDSSGQLLLFINNLIDQAQIESGKVILNMNPFIPAKLLDTIRSTAGALAEAKKLQLISEVAPDLPTTLIGDSYWLRQILSNLVGNAVKFTEQGAVKVRLYRADEGYWAMEVSDTGQGIAKGDQNYIFDAFRQTDGTATKKQGIGSGVGLSIVQQLTTMMDGRVTLTSEEGKGSVFTILLPLIRVPKMEKVTA